MNKNKITQKRIEAFSEMIILIIASFAFSYIIYEGDKPLNLEVSNKELDVFALSEIGKVFDFIFNKIKSPMIPFASALPSSCCEKTKEGATCINTNPSNCDSNYKSASTSCETTSYCKLGTCYDSQEGICMENTPKVVCDLAKGTWSEKSVGELAQCQLGCCVISNQASFVPLVRCKRMAQQYGVKLDYRTNIKSETQCIATAQSQDEGACVYTKDFAKTCKFTTRGDCSANEGVINGTNASLGSEKRFFKGYLCSAEELGTDCARETTTGCFQGKVYWYDSCGNKENVYSSDKVKSWNSGRVLTADSVCAANSGDNKDCGNCEFLLGSRCASYDKTILNIGKPSFGNFYCQKNVCKDSTGKERKNGESWCVYDAATGEGSDPAGSRHYKETCVDGKIQVEACGDFRSQICIEGSTQTSAGAFSSAACRVNRWQDCILQTKESNCDNSDVRDCIWTDPVQGLFAGSSTSSSSSGSKLSNPTANATFTNPTSTTTGKAIMTGNAIFGIGADSSEINTSSPENRKDGICLPSFPPGLKFWEGGDAQSICGQATAKCVVKYEKKILGSKTCVENCDCLESSWANEVNNVCKSLGDCGGYVNFVGAYTDDGYEWKVNEKEQKFSPNQVNTIKATGKAIMQTTGTMTGNVVVETILGIGIISALFTKLGLVSGALIPPATKIIPPVTNNFNGGLDTILKEGAAKQTESQTFQPAIGPAKETAEKVAAANVAKIPAGKVSFEGLPGLESLTGAKEGIAIKDFLGHTLTDADKIALQNNGVTNLGLNNAGQLQSFNYANTQYALGESGKWSATQTKGVFFGYGPQIPVGGVLDTLITGVTWAAIAYGAGYLIGSVLGMTNNNVQALSISLAAAAGVAGVLNTGAIFQGSTGFWANFGTQGLLGGLTPYVIGIGIGVGIFLWLYKSEDSQTVTFSCMPWQAPRGGSNCEKCNDPLLPCSEYRCKSLGQSCEIVNKGTSKEQCVNVAPNDVAPPVITPNDTELTSGYKYINVKLSPPGPGFTIINSASENGCVKPFTPLRFGVSTNEPAQCKIDFNSTTKLDDMQYWMGGSNIYSYDHIEQFTLPGPKSYENNANLTPILNNGGKWTYYIRCRDKNGNENAAEYAARFCVDDSPDTTPPEIKATSIINGGCVAEFQNSTAVEFYVNEPSECKWSKEDKDYKNMENNMVCTTETYQINALQLYTCRTTLTGLGKDLTDYYVRCIDQPGANENDRNPNKQSYKFSLRGSNRLKLKSFLPNETIFSGLDPAPVTLSAETLFGCDEGKAVCFYSLTGNENDYIQFFSTTDIYHTQRQDLTAGTHTFYLKCVDGGGNVITNKTTFTVNIDTAAPVIARVYQEGTDKLLIKTTRNSECSYSSTDCDFTINEGTPMPYSNSTTHITDWKKDKTFYIKCMDEFKNEPSDCSIIVRPTANLFKIA